jgi:hypothetical protein
MFVRWLARLFVPYRDDMTSVALAALWSLKRQNIE